MDSNNLSTHLTVARDPDTSEHFPSVSERDTDAGALGAGLLCNVDLSSVGELKKSQGNVVNCTLLTAAIITVRWGGRRGTTDVIVNTRAGARVARLGQLSRPIWQP